MELEKLQKAMFPIASFIINTLLLSTVPTAISLCYLWSWKFFSYDFINDGFFALSISTIICYFIFLIMLIPFVIGASFSSKYLVEKVFFKGDPNNFTKWSAVLFLPLSIILSILVYLELPDSKPVSSFIKAVFVIMIPVYLYLGVVISKVDTKVKAVSLVSTIVLTNLIVLFNPIYSAQMLSFGLMQFSIGGGVPMEFRETDSLEHKQGWKVLESPQYVYFIDSCYQKAISSVDRNRMYDYRTYPNLGSSFNQMLGFIKSNVADVAESEMSETKNIPEDSTCNPYK